MNFIDNFINQYPVTKTIRMGLKPIGKTKQNIEKYGVLEKDESLAESAKKVKPIIDRYILAIIDKGLINTKLEGLNEYMEATTGITDNEALEKAQAKLRSQTIKDIAALKEFEPMFKSDLIKKLLPEYVKSTEEQNLISQFRKNTGYFNDFLKNRKLLFDINGKHGSIAYRIVHENLPKYISNMTVFKVKKKKSDFNYTEIKAKIEKELDLPDISVYTDIDGFNNTLTQRGIEIYNLMIGGKSLENGEKIKGLNEYINEYNTAHKKDKAGRLPGFTKLFKQILSPVDTFSFVEEPITSDRELMDLINGLKDGLLQNVFESEKSVSPYTLFGNIKNYDLSGIYITEATMSTISNYLYKDWGYLRKEIVAKYVRDAIAENPKLADKPTKKFEKEKEAAHKRPFTIDELDLLVSDIAPIEDYFTLRINEIKDRIELSQKQYESINWDFEKGSKIQNSYKTTTIIKDYLDNLNELRKFVNDMTLINGLANYDVVFYSNVSTLADSLKVITKVLNKTRNYLTQKPYSKAKFRLTFDCGQLLDGWSRTVENQKRGTIFIKDGMYYLGIISANATKCLENIPAPITKDVYSKMDYMLFGKAYMSLPRIIFGGKKCSGKNIDFYNPSEEIKNIYINETFKDNTDDLYKLIDFYKECIKKNKEWDVYNLKFSDTSTYKNIADFYREIDCQGYSVTFRNIDAAYINKLVDDGSLYLFQIWNKDFSPNSKGTPDIYTMYLRSLFNKDNLKNGTIRINGGAAVYFREKSINSKDIIVHRAGEPIPTKNPDTDHKESVFKYDIIKDRRYTYDGFEFHFPIMINAVSEELGNINAKARELIKNTPNSEFNIIGIDISERGLVSYSVVDYKGNILEQKSLNVINGTDYYKLLDKREKEMHEAKENWQAIGSIKQIKEGYLSLALNCVVDAMIRFNALLFIENFTTSFKKSRQKADKQIYQIFATKLINKLNYCFDKHKSYNENGGILRGYQLTNVFESLTKIGFQNGLLFNTSSWLTSCTDPTTGFTGLKYVPYKNKAASMEFINGFKNICYNGDYFLFHVDDDEIGDWTVCSFGERTEFSKDEKGVTKFHKYDLTKEFKSLFAEYGIDITNSNLVEQIVNVDSKEFYERFHTLYNLINHMNNYGEEPYFISPVKNKHGQFFDTRETKNGPNSIYTLGAYNIAKKGWWTIEQIKALEDKKKLPKLDKVEWIIYVSDNAL